MGVRDLRMARGWSLDELGRRAGIERSRLSRFERGYVALTDKELARIAGELEITTESLNSADVEPIK